MTSHAPEGDARFRSLVENVADVVTILDPLGTVQYGSPAVERVLGYRVGELEGRNLFALAHPDEAAALESSFREALQDPERRVAYELRFRHRDGSYRWLEGCVVSLLHDPAVRGVVLNSHDVTQRIEAETRLSHHAQALEREHALFEQLFACNPAAVALVDPEDRVLRVNAEFSRLFGYTEDEVVGRPVGALIVPEELQDECRALTEQAAEGERVEAETRRRRKDGVLLHVAITVIPVRLHGDQIAVYAMYRDITGQKALESALERQAITDPLTGLLNRRGFLASLSQEWDRAKRSDHAPLLLFADLDGLKQINDTHGHAEGDQVLREVAEVLKRCFRASDAIARLGGDEFVVLAADAEASSEELMSERVRRALRRLNDRRGAAYRVSLSLGVIRAPASESVFPEDVLAEADRRMYEQKRARAASPGTDRVA